MSADEMAELRVQFYYAMGLSNQMLTHKHGVLLKLYSKLQIGTSLQCNDLAATSMPARKPQCQHENLQNV